MQLPVRHQQQTANHLCWAACASMVCDFYGRVVTQAKFSTRFNAKWGHGPNAMATAGETAYLIKELTHGAVTMDIVHRALTWQECKQHVTLRRLVIVLRQNHYFVISGFEDHNSMLWINDPARSGAIQAPYATVARGWVASLVKT